MMTRILSKQIGPDKHIILSYGRTAERLKQKTGIPVNLIKTVMYPYLRVVWNALRYLKFHYNSMYFRAFPDYTKISLMKPEEVEITMSFLAKDSKQKRIIKSRMSFSIRKNKAINQKAK